MRRGRYSIQLIRDGRPEPKGYRSLRRTALDFAREQSSETGLEVRVWSTRAARPIATIPAKEAAHG